MTKRVAMDFTVTFNDSSAAEIERHSFLVLEALDERDDLIDADLTITLSKRRASFTFMVDAPDSAEALATATRAFVTAMHEAATPTSGLQFDAGAREAALAVC